MKRQFPVKFCFGQGDSSGMTDKPMTNYRSQLPHNNYLNFADSHASVIYRSRQHAFADAPLASQAKGAGC